MFHAIKMRLPQHCPRKPFPKRNEVNITSNKRFKRVVTMILYVVVSCILFCNHVFQQIILASVWHLTCHPSSLHQLSCWTPESGTCQAASCQPWLWKMSCENWKRWRVVSVLGVSWSFSEFLGVSLLYISLLRQEALPKYRYNQRCWRWPKNLYKKWLFVWHPDFEPPTIMLTDFPQSLKKKSLENMNLGWLFVGMP